jgi:hypothetical protein
VPLKNPLDLSRKLLTAKQRYERAASSEKALRRRMNKLLGENEAPQKGGRQTPPASPKARARRSIGAVRERLIRAEMTCSKAEAEYREAAKLWREANPVVESPKLSRWAKPVVKVRAAPIISRLPQMTPD